MKKVVGVLLSAVFVVAVMFVVYRWTMVRNFVVGSTAAAA